LIGEFVEPPSDSSKFAPTRIRRTGSRVRQHAYPRWIFPFKNKTFLSPSTLIVLKCHLARYRWATVPVGPGNMRHRLMMKQLSTRSLWPQAFKLSSVRTRSTSSHWHESEAAGLSRRVNQGVSGPAQVPGRANSDRSFPAWPVPALPARRLGQISAHYSKGPGRSLTWSSGVLHKSSRSCCQPLTGTQAGSQPRSTVTRTRGYDN
jgi:hypothetical protein